MQEGERETRRVTRKRRGRRAELDQKRAVERLAIWRGGIKQNLERDHAKDRRRGLLYYVRCNGHRQYGRERYGMGSYAGTERQPVAIFLLRLGRGFPGPFTLTVFIAA